MRIRLAGLVLPLALAAALSGCAIPSRTDALLAVPVRCMTREAVFVAIAFFNFDSAEIIAETRSVLRGAVAAMRRGRMVVVLVAAIPTERARTNT